MNWRVGFAFLALTLAGAACCKSQETRGNEPPSAFVPAKQGGTAITWQGRCSESGSLSERIELRSGGESVLFEARMTGSPDPLKGGAELRDWEEPVAIWLYDQVSAVVLKCLPDNSPKTVAGKTGTRSLRCSATEEESSKTFFASCKSSEFFLSGDVMTK